MGRPRMSKRTREQIENDMVFESELFLKGYSYREIAQRLNEHNKKFGLDYQMSHAGVFKDMQRAMVQWKKERFDNIDEYIQQDLKKLDRMEQTAWEAWEKSCTGKERVKSRDSKKPNKKDAEVNDPDYYGYTETSNETSSGNPRFLDILLNIQQRRAKLLGYDAPVKVDVSGKTSHSFEGPRYDAKDIPDDLLFAVVDKLQSAEFNKEMEAKNKSEE